MQTNSRLKFLSMMASIAGVLGSAFGRKAEKKDGYHKAPDVHYKHGSSKNQHDGTCRRKGHAWRNLRFNEFQCCRCNKKQAMRLKDWSDPANWNWHRIARHFNMTVNEFARLVKQHNNMAASAVRELQELQAAV